MMEGKKGDKYARANKGKRSRFTELKDFPFYATEHDSAAKHWLFHGEDKRGSGVRNSAHNWKIGESGKQISILKVTGKCHGNTVGSIYLSIFITNMRTNTYFT